MTSKVHSLELFPRDIEAIAAKLGMPNYSCKQILSWIYEKKVESVNDMTNIRKEYREELKDQLFFRRSTTLTTKLASDGTVKKLLAWDDGERQTEAVMIPDKESKDRMRF